MSLIIGTFVMIGVIVVYIIVNFLTRWFPHRGRDPIDALYSVSQWDPNGIKFTGQCYQKVGTLPGGCIIEGEQRITRAATRTCAADMCIGFEGENVTKGESVPFQASCAVSFCGMARCRITFDGVNFVEVSGPEGEFSLSATRNGTYFYMQRITETKKGLVLDANGSIAQFYLISQDYSRTYMLCYTNTSRPSKNDNELTMLVIQPTSRTGLGFLDMFLLMNTLPMSIVGAGTDKRSVAKKILAFGGSDFQVNPSSAERAAFSSHEQSKIWAAINAKSTYVMTMIKWNADLNGFFGSTTPYEQMVYQWSDDSGVIQDAVESRLGDNLERSKPLEFYAWQ